MLFRSTFLATTLSLLAPLASAQTEEPTREELEAAFAERLTNVKLVGFTTLDGEEGVKEDSYTIQSATKLEDGRWRFVAQIEFGGRAVPMAMALPVEWAGDTPVITVDDMKFPMMGSYTARVLFHGDQYVGVWTGKGYGGQMYGKVVPIADGEAGADEPAADEEADTGGGNGAWSGPGLSIVEDGVHWPSFRGPFGRGVADAHPTPIEWNVEKGDGVRWSAELPGMAHSSPVVWGDKLFLTTAIRVDGEQELRVGLYGDIAPVEDESEFAFGVYCLDKKTGDVLWEQISWEGVPAIKRHTKGSHCSSSPAVDAERVVAFYGTEGLFCYDHDGELLWSTDFGVLDAGYFLMPDAQWGFSSSPVLHDGKVIVQCDVQGQSFVSALDAATGKELWRTNREEVPTWSTPTVDVREGRSQVICNGWKHIGGYDLATGKELWKLVGGGDIPVPTPIVSHDLILITNAHGQMAPIYAIHAMAEGELTIDPKECEGMAWSYPARGNYMQTPLVYGEEAYFCNDSGILSAYDVTSGESIYRERLGAGRSGFTGSGVAADGKLYFTSEEGQVYVVQAGPDFAVLAENDLGEEFMSSPAISEGVLYFRSRTRLTAVGE